MSSTSLIHFGGGGEATPWYLVVDGHGPATIEVVAGGVEYRDVNATAYTGRIGVGSAQTFSANTHLLGFDALVLVTQ